MAHQSHHRTKADGTPYVTKSTPKPLSNDEARRRCPSCVRYLPNTRTFFGNRPRPGGRKTIGDLLCDECRGVVAA